ncbi:MAG: hypothetical protein Q6L60_03765 [Thermostichus sp. HHBFW_bins_43]
MVTTSIQQLQIVQTRQQEILEGQDAVLRSIAAGQECQEQILERLASTQAQQAKDNWNMNGDWNSFYNVKKNQINASIFFCRKSVT